jgi:hypothetical protein
MAILRPANSVFLKTRAAIEQHVFIGDERISVKADRGHVIDFVSRRLIERFDVGQDMIELHAGQADFAGSQSVKHESIVAVGRMREANFRRLGQGCRCGHAGSVLAPTETPTSLGPKKLLETRARRDEK